MPLVISDLPYLGPKEDGQINDPHSDRKGFSN